MAETPRGRSDRFVLVKLDGIPKSHDLPPIGAAGLRRPEDAVVISGDADALGGYSIGAVVEDG